MKKNKQSQLYFRSIDDIFTETLEDLLSDAKIEGLSEVTVIEAIPDNETADMIWCSHHGECGEKSECRKSICPQYESKSGRGACKHRAKLYRHGEEKTFKIE